MTAPDEKLQMCIVINPAFGLVTCYGGQYAHLQARGFGITAVSGVGDAEHDAARALGVESYVIPMARYASLVRDLRSLVSLWRFFRSRHASMSSRCRRPRRVSWVFWRRGWLANAGSCIWFEDERTSVEEDRGVGSTDDWMRYVAICRIWSSRSR